MVASPNLTLTITAPGGSPTDYTSHLAYSGTESQNTITQNFGRQGDTATLVLVDEFTSTPNVIIQALSRVTLFDHIANDTLFAGVVTAPDMWVDGPLRREWTLACVDNAWYADGAKVHGVFYNLTADQIVIALTRQANCGITAAAVAAGGFVAPGPVLPAVVINWMSLSDAWRKLAQLSGISTPYGWYVDELLRLHFYDATTALSSGVTFTTSPTAAGAGSTTEAHFGADTQFGYTWDAGSIRNRILVQGATQTIQVPTTGPATDVFRADGVATSWPLRYALTGTPVLTVGGVGTTLTVASGGTQGSGAWVAEQNAVGAWFLTTSAGAPSAGTHVRIWYNYQVPIVMQANDTASQALYNGPNHGVYADYISDSSLTTPTMALARAQRERTEYAFPAERLTWTATEEFMGWVRAGQTCLVTNQWIPDAGAGYALGLTNAPFIVVANQITFSDGGYRTMAVTAVRL